MTSDAGPAPVAYTAPPTRDGASVVLSAEQLRTTTEWVQSGQVRLRRRIVSETRTIEVVVRREELTIETVDVTPGAVGESYRGSALDGLAATRPPVDHGPPLVFLLREEVPEIVLRPQVYERVTADVVTVNEVAVWHDRLQHEQADTSH